LRPLSYSSGLKPGHLGSVRASDAVNAPTTAPSASADPTLRKKAVRPDDAMGGGVHEARLDSDEAITDAIGDLCVASVVSPATPGRSGDHRIIVSQKNHQLIVRFVIVTRRRA